MRIAAWPARKNAARNPFQKLLYDAVEQQPDVLVDEFTPRSLLSVEAPDVLHMHWPDVFVRSDSHLQFWARLLALRVLATIARRRAIPIVWTAHNLRRRDSGSNLLNRHFWPWFLPRVDGVIFMSHASLNHAARHEPALAEKPAVVIRHGHYLPVVAPIAEGCEGRQTVVRSPDDSRPIVMTFGAITVYKQVSSLVRAYSELEPGEVDLVVAGRLSWVDPDPDFEPQMAAMPENHRAHCYVADRLLPDRELVDQLRSADLCVFPYAEVHNSGAAIYALSAGCPILVPDLGAFQELADLVGPGWVSNFTEPLDGNQIRDAVAIARETRARQPNPNLAALEWDSIAVETADFYQLLLAGRKATADA